MLGSSPGGAGFGGGFGGGGGGGGGGSAAPSRGSMQLFKTRYIKPASVTGRLYVRLVVKDVPSKLTISLSSFTA